eukprot:1727752-Amphidinium_carterae.1
MNHVGLHYYAICCFITVDFLPVKSAVDFVHAEHAVQSCDKRDVQDPTAFVHAEHMVPTSDIKHDIQDSVDAIDPEGFAQQNSANERDLHDPGGFSPQVCRVPWW